MADTNPFEVLEREKSSPTVKEMEVLSTPISGRTSEASPVLEVSVEGPGGKQHWVEGGSSMGRMPPCALPSKAFQGQWSINASAHQLQGLGPMTRVLPVHAGPQIIPCCAYSRSHIRAPAAAQGRSAGADSAHPCARGAARAGHARQR